MNYIYPKIRVCEARKRETGKRMIPSSGGRPDPYRQTGASIQTIPLRLMEPIVVFISKWVKELCFTINCINISSLLVEWYDTSSHIPKALACFGSFR